MQVCSHCKIKKHDVQLYSNQYHCKECGRELTRILSDWRDYFPRREIREVIALRKEEF